MLLVSAAVAVPIVLLRSTARGEYIICSKFVAMDTINSYNDDTQMTYQTSLVLVEESYKIIHIYRFLPTEHDIHWFKNIERDACRSRYFPNP